MYHSSDCDCSVCDGLDGLSDAGECEECGKLGPRLDTACGVLCGKCWNNADSTPPPPREDFCRGT